MDISELLIEAYKLLDAAQVDDGTGYRNNAIKQLAKLRELLNSQPELEAGGAIERDETSQPSTMWEHLH